MSNAPTVFANIDRRAAGVAIAAFFLLLAPGLHARSVVEETTQETYALNGSANVTIRNADGRIHVYGTANNEITIIAVKRAFSKERVALIKVNAVVTPESAVVDTIYPPAPEGMLADRSGTVDYVIYVPQGCTLASAELANGEVLLDGLRGPSADGRTGKGRILARNCFTNLRLAVGQGGLDVFYLWWEQRAFSLSTEIASGNTRLGLPPNTAARIDVATTSGHIKDRFSKRGQEDGPVRVLNATIGEGSEVDLKLRSASGNISIEKSY